MEEIWTRELRGDLVAGGRNGKHGSYRDERESLFMMENDTKKKSGQSGAPLAQQCWVAMCSQCSQCWVAMSNNLASRKGQAMLSVSC